MGQEWRAGPLARILRHRPTAPELGPWEPSILSGARKVPLGLGQEG